MKTSLSRSASGSAVTSGATSTATSKVPRVGMLAKLLRDVDDHLHHLRFVADAATYTRAADAIATLREEAAERFVAGHDLEPMLERLVRHERELRRTLARWRATDVANS